MSKKVPVEATDITGKVIKSYNSIAEAAKDGYNARTIHRCLIGRSEKHRDLYWRKARK